ncbi:hypothetical protein F4859DRAFT_34894 [Xylaria cf. heliscus]|nr:hypothetical protein F4859DRAFT_34894 [Xylaria cf. heliscus]
MTVRLLRTMHRSWFFFSQLHGPSQGSPNAPELGRYVRTRYGNTYGIVDRHADLRTNGVTLRSRNTLRGHSAVLHFIGHEPIGCSEDGRCRIRTLVFPRFNG